MQSVNTQEKQIKIDGLNINYKQIGNGDVPIILLHGWGVSSDKYSAFAEHLSQFSIFNFQFSIFVPDLPGFGKSDEPNENWNLDDYVEFTDKFIKSATQARGFELIKNILKKMQPKFSVLKESLQEQKKIQQNNHNNLQNIDEGQIKILNQVQNDNVCEMKKIILIGHSFGGRIVIKYAKKYPEKIDKLILTGAAGIKHKLTAKQKIFFIMTKTGKIIFSLPAINNFQKPIYKIFSKIARQKKKDYYCVSSRMKEIMKNVLDENLTDDLDKIKNPALLIWGREDKSTPLIDGKIMNKKIKNSKLVVVDNANHSLPYQKPEEFAKIVNLTLVKTNTKRVL